jgi:hypothetical protein
MLSYFFQLHQRIYRCLTSRISWEGSWETSCTSIIPRCSHGPYEAGKQVALRSFLAVPMDRGGC